MPNKMQVESATAWLFYITKHNANEEQLAISMTLIDKDSTVQRSQATGQNLIAIEFENSIRQMHLGTEDEESMAYRASIQDYMPERFKSPLLNFEIEVTSITTCGLVTQIPKLKMGEQFYFHYIMAENPYHQSVDYPDESDQSTWFAVEQSKKQLERVWRTQV
ncbi:hypothetical protein [uncultured Hymenobacter sp.]|uniref:hypothetical protein n=1 Tax=uncultured Hymenobacter sp. TaxID=170016 RepID=UPI0035CAD62C